MVRSWLEVIVIRRHVEAEGVVLFEFADAMGRQLPSFSAGSHIDVEIRPGLVRQYSLCNDPAERHRYQIAVLKDPASRGGSSAMHEKIAEAEVVRISEPRNQFELVGGNTESLLIAGGIGITPILCMAERLFQSSATFKMHYAARSRRCAAFVERIEGSPFVGRVQFHFDDGAPEQRLDLPTVLAKPELNRHLYVCGPSGLIDATHAVARQAGWAEDNLHREYFGAVETTPRPGDEPFKVRLASDGRVFDIPVGSSIATVLMEGGVEVPVSCEIGICGTCITHVLQGTPEHRDTCLSEAEKSAGDQIAVCCSRARSDLLVLDL